jgi:hypothetical protein
MAYSVECHSDYTYAERPVALVWEGRRLVVAECLAEWRTPEAKHFRVRTNDERVFELSFQDATHEWQVTQP